MLAIKNDLKGRVFHGLLKGISCGGQNELCFVDNIH